MTDFLPFIVVGITTGSVYGLAATGLVLTYKTSGIFNFAYGSIAALTVFVFYFLHVEHGWPWPLAALVCLFVLAPLQGLVMERLARVLDPLGSSVRVVATVGLILIVIGIGDLWYGSGLTIIPSFLPTSSIGVLGVQVSWAQIVTTVVAVVATVGLYILFRWVRIGVAMRGVVDNPELLSLTGESPVRVRRRAWLIGSMFSSLAGLLLAPSLSLDALVITLLVVQAFGAAAVGYFSSLPLTFAGGLVIGILGSLSTKYAITIPALAGLPPSLPFAVLFIVLIVTPKSKLVQRRIVPSMPVQASYRAPVRVRLGFGAVVLALFIAIPALAPGSIPVWSFYLVSAILLLSLGILVRLSGQISLCQMTFAAIGAASFSRLSVDYDFPWLLALAGCAVIALPIGALLAIPAIRLSGVFLALATLGFGIFVEQMFFTTDLMFGPSTSGLPAPRPSVSIFGLDLSSDRGFYYVVLVALVLAVGLAMFVQYGRLGRLLTALSDSPLALESYGAAITVTRVVIFCISAAVASIAGALIAMLYHFSVGFNYPFFNSLTLLAVLVIVTIGAPWYALLAAIGISLIPGFITSVNNLSIYLEILFGVFAISFAFQARRLPTVPQPLQRFLDRVGGRAPPADALASAAPLPKVVVRSSEPVAVAPERPREVPGLAVTSLVVRFGGVIAVNGFSMTAPLGAITGLVGPNGAGKTTTFNACSGLVRPSSGRVHLCGEDVTGMRPSARARRGLGRTFQTAQLFDSLSVVENIALGREAALAGQNPLRQLVGAKHDRPLVRREVAEAVELVGIGHLLERQAGLLPTGQRRLVELARVLAGGFDLLLLDEPSSGLDLAETRAFGEILRRVVADRGIGVILVGHDMALVTAVCERVCVLDFGCSVFEGTAAEMVRSPVVQAAYLGENVETSPSIQEPLETTR